MENNIQKKIIKIAKRIISSQVDQKLFNKKTKQNAKNYIYKQVQLLTRGFFRDEDWSNVRKVWEKIESLGVDLDVEVKNGGYFNDRTTGKIAGKTYHFNIHFQNIQGKQFDLPGELICSFCGTVDDPMSVYDMAFIIY